MQRDFSGHGQIMMHRLTGQRGNQRRGQRNACGRPVLGHGALRGVNMDVGVFELFGINAIRLGVDPGIGHRELRALLHHIAQAAGQLDLAGTAWNDGNLHRQHLAAHAGPGKAVGNAHRIFPGDKGRLDLFRAKKFLDHGGADRNFPGLTCGNLLGTLAQDRGDGPLQSAHAGLPGIAVNDLINCLRGNGDHSLQTVVFELLGKQMPLGDVVLFHAGIAGQFNDIHTVIERPGNMGGIVGRGDEKNLAQIKGDVQIVVLERQVLLRVQHFQQRTGGVAAIIAGQFVNLIQQNNGVRRLGGIDCADDASRHGADVSTAVAADLGLVMYTAQTHAGKLAAHALRHRAGDGGFAHTRRTNQADDLPFDIGVQLAHGKNFEDSLLDLLKAVMIAVQHPAGVGLIQVILSDGVPGQCQNGIQIAADHTDLRLIAGHFGKAVAFLEKLFLAGGIQLERLDFLSIVIRFHAGIIAVAQFLADDVHLLPQIIITLVFVHLDIYFIVQFFLNGKHIAFLAQQHQQLFQTAQQGSLVEDGLFVLILEKQVGRHVFAQEKRIVRGDNIEHHVLGNLRAEGKVFLKAFLDAADERLCLGAFFGGDAAHRHGADFRLKEFAAGIQLQQFGAAFALHKDLHQILRNPQDLLDLCDHTVGVKVLDGGFLGIHLFLGNEKNAAVGMHGCVDGGNGLLPSHLKMNHVVGKHHQTTQRDGRQVHHIAGHADPDLLF